MRVNMKVIDDVLGVIVRILYIFFVLLGVYGMYTLNSMLLFYAIVGLFGIGIFGVLYLIVEKIISVLIENKQKKIVS